MPVPARCPTTAIGKAVPLPPTAKMWRAVGPRRLRLYVLCADEADAKLWRVLMVKCNMHTASVPELTLEQVRKRAPNEGWSWQDPLQSSKVSTCTCSTCICNLQSLKAAARTREASKRAR